MNSKFNKLYQYKNSEPSHKPNRAERRKMMKGQKKKKKTKDIPENMIDLMLACPDCGSIDLIELPSKDIRLLGDRNYPQQFECKDCGSIHYLIELTTNL